MNKDYLKINCKSNDGDVLFVSIGDYFCLETVTIDQDGLENGISVYIDKSDIEKILPLILKYYFDNGSK